jgi:5S rRNA maturation endonuclease (ribonuclease M5)
LSKFLDNQEKLLKLISSLIEESEKGSIIVVEGPKDVKVMRKLGINGTIITCKTNGKSFLDVLSKIKKTKSSQVILLMDFDKRGKNSTKFFQQELEHNKIKYTLKYWHELIALTSKEIQYIESLDAYLINLNNKILKNRKSTYC